MLMVRPHSRWVSPGDLLMASSPNLQHGSLSMRIPPHSPCGIMSRMHTRHDPSPIRVAIVEDDVHFLAALRCAVEQAPDMQLGAVSCTRAHALQALEGQAADVLLVDLGLPDGSGIDVIRAAVLRWPQCGIMVSTAFGDEQHVMQSLEAGAAGYLLKDSAPHSMLAEIRSLHAGGSPISPLIARQVLMRFMPKKAEPLQVPPMDRKDAQISLSAREREVLEFITKGFTADEISKLMDISRHTVQTFVRRIYGKLEVRSRAEAIYEARYRGLLDD
jgi:DNA-binding NarL/FixJ family response regulator